MTPAQAARAIGCKSLRQVSEVSGVPVSTLRDWFESRRFVFDAVCEKAAAISACSIVVAVNVSASSEEIKAVIARMQQEQQQ